MFERFLLGLMLSYCTYISLGLAQGVFLMSIIMSMHGRDQY